MQWTNRHILAFGYFSLLAGVWWGCDDYRVNVTNSLPRGLYRETSDLIHYGTLVAECLPEQWATLGKERGWFGSGSCPTNTPPILKQVAAMAGDTIEVADEYVAVNGALILQSATQKVDSQGRAMPVFPRGLYTLKTGEVWLLTTNIPNSLDSRYMGPAQASDLIATARPVWTEGRNER